MEEKMLSGASAGPSTDRTGAPVIDPTKNVFDLVVASVKRIEDIHQLQTISNKHILELSIQRQDDLRVNEVGNIKEILALRSHYDELLRNKETERLNAIRVVDVNAVTEASRVAAAQALTLANQVATSAETLRTQVGTVATATATALANALEPLQKSIEDLRKTQYAQQGEKAAHLDVRTVNDSSQHAVQWAIGLAVTIVIIIVQIILHFLK